MTDDQETEPGVHLPEDPARRPPVDYDPPWREARRRVAAASARGGTPTRVVLVLAGGLAVAFLGAFVFGLWHVVVGGIVKGNWNAGGFGIALASVAGVLLWIEAATARRLLPAAAPRADRDPDRAASGPGGGPIGEI